MKRSVYYALDRIEEYYSPLSPAEVLAALRPLVADPPARQWIFVFSIDPTDSLLTNPAHLFWGELTDDSFTVWLRSGAHNARKPRTTGQVLAAPHGAGSIVRLHHRIDPNSLRLIIIWLIPLAGASAYMLLDELFRGVFSAATLFPVGMMTLGVLSLVVPLWYEIWQARPLLVQHLRLESTAPAA